MEGGLAMGRDPARERATGAGLSEVADPDMDRAMAQGLGTGVGPPRVPGPAAATAAATARGPVLGPDPITGQGLPRVLGQVPVTGKATGRGLPKASNLAPVTGRAMDPDRATAADQASAAALAWVWATRAGAATDLGRWKVPDPARVTARATGVGAVTDRLGVIRERSLSCRQCRIR
jgi:hypothetical protein